MEEPELGGPDAELAQVVSALRKWRLEAGRRLDLHYGASRYPNGLPSGYPHAFYGKGTAEQALADADKLFAMVKVYYRGAGEDELSQEPPGGGAAP